MFHNLIFGTPFRFYCIWEIFNQVLGIPLLLFSSIGTYSHPLMGVGSPIGGCGLPKTRKILVRWRH